MDDATKYYLDEAEDRLKEVSIYAHYTGAAKGAVFVFAAFVVEMARAVDALEKVSQRRPNR